MNELAVFAGAGGGILAAQLQGWRTVCAVELDAYAASVLAQRQNDGSLEPFPIWSDVRSFDGKPWRGIVDVVSGGFPCQDISVAGTGKGLDGERSGLWRQMHRIICEVRPRFVFVENSPALVSRGLGSILRDLALLGFDAEWGVLGANQVGAPHRRDRLWIVAHADHSGFRGEIQQKPDARRTKTPHPGSHGQIQPMAHADRIREYEQAKEGHKAWDGIGHRSWWSVEPSVGRVADGVAYGVDRIRALGNGQVPLCAAEAFRLLNRWG